MLQKFCAQVSQDADYSEGGNFRNQPCSNETDGDASLYRKSKTAGELFNG